MPVFRKTSGYDGSQPAGAGTGAWVGCGDGGGDGSGAWATVIVTTLPGGSSLDARGDWERTLPAAYREVRWRTTRYRRSSAASVDCALATVVPTTEGTVTAGGAGVVTGVVAGVVLAAGVLGGA